MPRSISYIRFPGDVRVSEKPDARGYHRCRWTNKDGTPGDRRISSWAEAEAFAFELSAVIRSDHSGAPRLGDQPIGALIDAWHEPAVHDKPLSPTYIKTASCWQEKYIRPTIGNVRAGAWAAEHTRKVLAAGMSSGLSDSSLNRLRRDMMSLVAVGKRLGYLSIQQDPFSGLRARRVDNAPDLAELPGRADIKKLALAMEELSGLWWRGLQVHILALTGLRIGELLGLTHDDIDLDRKRLRVDRQILTVPGAVTGALPKYGSVRTVPLPSALTDQLGRLMEEHVDLEPQTWQGHGKMRAGEGIPLFPSARGQFERYSTFKNQRWGPACYAAGWKRAPSGRGFVWTPHTLRHFYCTMALAAPPEGAGLDVVEVSRHAGHKSPEFTWKVYVQSMPGRIERGTEAMNALDWDL